MKQMLFLLSISAALLSSCKDENAGRQIAELQNKVSLLQHTDSSLAIEVDSLRMLLCSYIAKNGKTYGGSERSTGKTLKKGESAPPAGNTSADPVAAKPPMSKAEANYKKLHSWECSKCHKVVDMENKPKAKPCPKGGMHDWQ